jgi:hypothetical protein
MTLFASCGHEIVDDDKYFPLSLMEWGRCGERAVSYGNYCQKCRNMYLDYGLVLDGDEDEARWFNGEIDYPEFDWDE